MTTSKTTISISEGRKRIFDIAEEVQTPNRVYTLTSEGKPKIVIMSAEEYESWMETIEVFRMFPHITRDIAETDRAIKNGAYKTWATLDQIEKKMKKKYAIPNRPQTKSRKTAR